MSYLILLLMRILRMMEKIKAFFQSLWGVIVLIGTAAIGILLYMLQRKQREVNSLKAKIELAKTQKEADLIEVEIKKKLDNVNILDKEQKELTKTLAELEAKRKQIASTEKNKTDQEIDDFWNKK